MVPFQILHEMSYLSVQLISCQFQYQLYGFFDLQNVCSPPPPPPFQCRIYVPVNRVSIGSVNGLSPRRRLAFI